MTKSKTNSAWDFTFLRILKKSEKLPKPEPREKLETDPPFGLDWLSKAKEVVEEKK